MASSERCKQDKWINVKCGMYQLCQYKIALSSKKTHKAKTKVLTQRQSSVTSIDQVKSSFSLSCQLIGRKSNPIFCQLKYLIEGTLIRVDNIEQYSDI